LIGELIGANEGEAACDGAIVGFLVGVDECLTTEEY
jgi:hypothetical protein